MSHKTTEAKAVARKDLTYGQWVRKEMKRNWVAYLMIAPYVAIFTLFTALPVVLSFVISFTDFNMLQWPNMVWLENYINLFFADDVFLIACKNTLIFAVIVGPVSYLMSFLVAWFINELSPRIRSLVTLHCRSGLPDLGYSVCSRLPGMGQRNADRDRYDRGTDRLVPEYEIRYGSLYRGRPLDLARYLVPVLYRRFAGC